ncbi:hypothetical protein LCGC14_1438350 [marine sediment metagenome]|uniref:Uncharacterized protein n=1 Tax=marine sediment metagenome TaxID=412755 RepID=A0A0F9MNA7_9ZZZZ
MNDKELADKVVALGAGYKLKADSEQYCVFADCEWCDTVPASELVLDWRVAGALMEKLESYDGFIIDQLGDDAGVCTISVNCRDTRMCFLVSRQDLVLLRISPRLAGSRCFDGEDDQGR